MRRKAGWNQAGGPIDILKACQEITAGRGGCLSTYTILHTHHKADIAQMSESVVHSVNCPPNTCTFMLILISFICCFFEVDLSSWEQKIQRDAVAEQLDGERTDEGAESVLMEQQSDSAIEMSSPSKELYKDGVLTLGCIGIHLFTEKFSHVSRFNESSFEFSQTRSW